MKKYLFFQKRILLVLFLPLIFFTTGFAQQSSQLNALDQDHYKSTQTIYALTAYKMPVDKSDEKRLFNTEWISGVVYFKNGKQYTTNELQFDIDRNELHFRSNNKANIFADPVLYFILSDSSDGQAKSVVFKCGYPAIGLKTANTFYQVLTTGSGIHLIKYLVEKREESYQYNLAAKISYDITGDLYVYDVENNKIELISRSISSIKKALPAFASRIDEALKSKGNKRLSEDEVIILINRLNAGMAK